MIYNWRKAKEGKVNFPPLTRKTELFSKRVTSWARCCLERGFLNSFHLSFSFQQRSLIDPAYGVPPVCTKKYSCAPLRPLQEVGVKMGGMMSVSEIWPFGALWTNEKDIEGERRYEEMRERFRLCSPSFGPESGRHIGQMRLSPRAEGALVRATWDSAECSVILGYDHIHMARQREASSFSFLEPSLFPLRHRWSQNMVGIGLGSPANGSHHDWAGSRCPGTRAARWITWIRPKWRHSKWEGV